MFAHIFKDSAASTKAWRSRQRAKRTLAVTKLSEHYAKYDDPNITEEKILKGFTPQERAEVVNNVRKSQAAKTSAETYVKDGQYTPERQRLHQEIISKILSDAAIKAATPTKGETPTYIILGGRGGSGKSAFTDGTLKEFDASKFLKLDSDAIKEMLKPPYEGWNAYSVHEESAHIFDAITYMAHQKGLNIIHDSTLRSDGVGSTIAQMKSSGYRVEGHYMFLPRQVAAKRAVDRFLRKGQAERGRLVPPEVVLQNTSNEKNFERLSKYFDSWSAYDNQGAKGSTPTLITRGGTSL